MDYRELASLPPKTQIERLDNLPLDNLVELIGQAQQFYIHYSEQTSKYCNSVSEEMVRDEDNNPLYPKFDASQIITEEQFQGLLSKMKRCESIVSLIYGCISERLAFDEEMTDTNKSNLEKAKKEFNL